MKYSAIQIGKIIKKEREKLNLTQAKLGKKLGVQGAQISKFETGTQTPQVDTLYSLCEVFNCELGYLIGEDGYEMGTRAETSAVETTGLSEEAIKAIQSITGTVVAEGSMINFYAKHEPEKTRAIINRLFTTKSFLSLFERLYDLERCIEEYHYAFQPIIDQYGEDVFHEVLELYNSDVDYENEDSNNETEDSNIKLTETQIEVWNKIDKAIDRQAMYYYAIKPARYEVREEFDRMLYEIYPPEGRDKQ